MEGRKPLNLEGLDSMMKRMDEVEEGFSPDLQIVRPDQNQGCISSSSSSPPSPPSGIEKIDPASLSDFQLVDKITDYRNNLKLPLRDGGAKISQKISSLEKELARRGSQTQTGIKLDELKQTSPFSHSKLTKGKQDVFDLEVKSSSPEQKVARRSIDNGYPTIALECDKDESIPFSAHTPDSAVDGFQDLENSPRRRIAKVCFKCHQSVSNGASPSTGINELLCCSSCKEKPVSSPPNGMRANVCVLSKGPKISGSIKRSKQAVGGTFDTALELSDDEEVGEKIIGESSSSDLSMRKRLRSASKKLAGIKCLYPPSGDPEAVEVRAEDLQHLAPFEFLNDTVIDFYMKYMQVNFLEEEEDRFHFFSCFFYKKLTFAKKARCKNWFEDVHKWTKGVNLFKKSYLFVPIHDSCHWSLAIVCFFAEEKRSYIFHLDSMASTGHQSNIIFNVLKSYLQAEQKHLIQVNGNVEDITTDELVKPICKRALVPLQDNEWDCGLFMLYYIQRFVSDIDSKGFHEMFRRNWFKPNEASEMRGTIFSILECIFKVDEVT